MGLSNAVSLTEGTGSFSGPSRKLFMNVMKAPSRRLVVSFIANGFSVSTERHLESSFSENMFWSDLCRSLYFYFSLKLMFHCGNKGNSYGMHLV